MDKQGHGYGGTLKNVLCMHILPFGNLRLREGNGDNVD